METCVHGSKLGLDILLTLLVSIITGLFQELAIGCRIVRMTLNYCIIRMTVNYCNFCHKTLYYLVWCWARRILGHSGTG